MKKLLFLFLLSALYLAGCDSDNPSPIPSPSDNVQATIEGSTLDVLEGLENATQGFNTLKPEGLDDPIYISEGKLAGSAYGFMENNSQRLDEMGNVPTEDGWQQAAAIVDGKCYWLRHTATTLYTYLKLRVTYIDGNNVGVEYIIDSTAERETSSDNVNANLPIEGKAYVTDYSMPHLDPENIYVEHTVTFNEQEILNYAYEWVDSKKHAAWVAFTFDSETSQKNVNRTDEWNADPDLPDGMSPQESNHKNDGFDKGHLCASEDRVYSREANVQTFYYSNISPQLVSFNQGFWVTFEKTIQNWARSGDYDKLYVTKGGTLNHLLVNFTGTQKGQDGQTPTTDANGLTKHGLACPQYYFIAVLAEKGGDYQAIGFLAEHRDDYGYTNNNQAPISVVKEHALSIDELEEQTGLDFFCNLPDDIENQLESSYTESDWAF